MYKYDILFANKGDNPVILEVVMNYSNPVRRGFYPDPSVIRVGEDFYMVNSSFQYFPCIPISHSKDMIHWETIGHAITDPSYLDLSGIKDSHGIWGARYFL